MTENQSEVDALLARKNWHEERKKLRALLLDQGLTETVKWGKLCYTFEGKNVAIIYGLKDYCALGFFKGSLLDDDKGVLVAPGAHSQAMRQLRFSGLNEIAESEALVSSFVDKAIQAERAGLEVDFSEKDALVYPDELQALFDRDPSFTEAFEKLTPGRRRGYVLHFSDARRSGTRVSRIEKCRPMIMAGKGLQERS